MVRFSMFMIGIALIGAGFSSCGQNTDDKQKGDGDAAVTEEAATSAAVAGELKETPEFKILVPDGWQFSDYGGGAFQTYNNSSGSYMVEVRKAGLNMTEKDVESTMGNLAKQYKGSALKTVEMKGLKFFTTTFEAGGRHQTIYAALKDGAKISIALVGAEHETDPTIQAVFSSIVVK